MSGCTATGKPLISILMAVYEPRLDWLREQLESLEGQTYPNLRLYIRDDCSPTVPFEEIERCVRECIRSFPYEIRRNEKNLGSNGTFERLTGEAEGEYFAYCDQDDVWLPGKVALLCEELERTGSLLVCSDMSIIDESGRTSLDSFAKSNKFFHLSSGEGLAEKLLIRNFVVGCTMIIQADMARSAIPFCPYMVHDQYLALRAAMQGKLTSVSYPTIRHRIHGNNQTSVMNGVVSKNTYYDKRILLHKKRLLWLQKNMEENSNILEEIAQALIWVKAREALFAGRWTAWYEVWRYRRFSPVTSVFELMFALLPEKIFMCVVRLRQRGVL